MTKQKNILEQLREYNKRFGHTTFDRPEIKEILKKYENLKAQNSISSAR